MSPRRRCATGRLLCPRPVAHRATVTILETAVERYSALARNGRVASAGRCGGIEGGKGGAGLSSGQRGTAPLRNGCGLAAGEGRRAAAAVGQQVDAVLKPAENYGGRMSFRWVALRSAALAVIFAALYLSDRAHGKRAASSAAGRGNLQLVLAARRKELSERRTSAEEADRPTSGWRCPGSCETLSGHQCSRRGLIAGSRPGRCEVWTQAVPLDHWLAHWW